MRRSMRVLVTVAAGCALAVSGAVTAGAAPERGGAASSDDILAAVQRDLGLSATQARKVTAQQDKAVTLDASLRASLGSDFGGSWFDARSGKLVVNVTDGARSAEVTKAGAKAVVVEHSEAELDGILAELDALSGKAPGAARGQSGKSRLTGLAGWHVDPKSNSVVITKLAGKAQSSALGSLARYGDAVSYETTDRAPQRTADFMDGGDEINFASCSAGLNLRNPNTGQGYLLTAGHCTSYNQANYGQGGVYFGPTVGSFFPVYDDALIRNDNSSYWIQGPWADLYSSNGPVVTVSGYSDAPVGTFVCKAGITTKWSCGYITLKNETVVYNGDPAMTVYGLTRHSACVEPGDSGGANVAGLSTWSAEGVTSGAQLYWDGSRYRCAAAVNAGQSVSWYFPFADSIAYYGAAYGVTLW
jgi:streptogrisin C